MKREIKELSAAMNGLKKGNAARSIQYRELPPKYNNSEG